MPGLCLCPENILNKETCKIYNSLSCNLQLSLGVRILKSSICRGKQAASCLGIVGGYMSCSP